MPPLVGLLLGCYTLRLEILGATGNDADHMWLCSRVLHMVKLTTAVLVATSTNVEGKADRLAANLGERQGSGNSADPKGAFEPGDSDQDQVLELRKHGEGYNGNTRVVASRLAGRRRRQ